MGVEGQSTISLDRARAEIELLLAAYPDEISINGNSKKIWCEDAGTDKATTPAVLKITLLLKNRNLPDGEKGTQWAAITMGVGQNYPIETGLEVVSYRCGSGTSKDAIEKTVRAVRLCASNCLRNEEEAGLQCCLIARETWDQCIESDDLSRHGTDTGDDSNAERQSVILGDKSDGLETRWFSGEPLTDRKSTFQAHVAAVSSELMVRRALTNLTTGSSKMLRATHHSHTVRYCCSHVAACVNFLPGHSKYAYRFRERTHEGKNALKHDNDDDGEDGAGSRLAQLLAMREEDGVIVVVSRWFGGTHLGRKRFAYIVNVARDLLVRCHDDGVFKSDCTRLPA